MSTSENNQGGNFAHQGVTLRTSRGRHYAQKLPRKPTCCLFFDVSVLRSPNEAHDAGHALFLLYFDLVPVVLGAEGEVAQRAASVQLHGGV